MVLKFFLITSIGFFVVLLQGLYFYFKAEKAFLNLQQSGYDNSRFFRYIKSHYKYTFGINELLVILGVVLLKVDLLLGLFVMAFFMYYNLRFFNVANTRYIKKLKLNITNRVKRQIILYILLNLIISSILLILNINPFYIIILLTYFTYVLLAIVNTLLIPIENHIKNGFKKRAKMKLASYRDVEVIGITGSYGKTSIKNIIGGILNEFEPTLITPESYNTPMGLTITINNYLSPFHKNFIAEMGAYYEGEIDELAKLVSPKVGVVSSVGNQHLETFKTIEVIQKTKMELIEALPSDGLGILNFDNEYIRSYQIKNDVMIKYYSLENEDADIYAYDIEYLSAFMRFKIKFNNQEYIVETKLLGMHNVENILAGILVCDYKQIPIDKIIKSIAKLKPVKNRLEFKYVSPSLSIIDDAFNANTKGIKESIKILSTYEKKRRVIITPGLIDLGNEMSSFHKELGTYMTSMVDDIVLIGNLNKVDLLTGISESSFDQERVKCFDNFIDGYNYSIGLEGEKILLIANDLPDKFND
jgi:UDP-N-acetylmuramoyl-tripeptide--D-alanyl-D-alanine ligase